MPEKTQLLGISNAIVDVLTKVSMEFLKDMQIKPGSMNLIDENFYQSKLFLLGPMSIK